MSFQAACKVYTPKFFSKYYVDPNQIVYVGIDSDSGYFNYYLYGVGWIISTSLTPLKVRVDGSTFSCQVTDVNGFCTWASSSYKLYVAPHYLDHAGGSWNSQSFLIYMKDNVQPGHTPVQYYYTENNTTYYKRK